MIISRHWRVTLATSILTLLFSAGSFANPYSKDKLRDADFNNGRTAFLQRCSACHTLNEGGLDITGPNMWQLFERVVGSKPGYKFSDAMKNADFQWSAEKLGQWLTNPDSMLQGSKMVLLEALDEKTTVDLLSFMYVETGAADWPRPALKYNAKERDKSLPMSERFPSFWNHMMNNTTRYRLVTSAGEEYIFKLYFKTDGSISSDIRSIKGFWHLDKRDFMCYAAYGIPIEPKYMVECFPVAAMAIPRFREELWESKPSTDWTLYGGILPGRPDSELQ